MVNQVVLIGTVSKTAEIKKSSGGYPYATLTLEVVRGYKNSEGTYDKDVFEITMWRGIAESCTKLCEKGNIVAVKGRLQSSQYTNNEGNTYINLEIIAERVSFIAKK